MTEKLRVLHLEDDRLHTEITRALLAEDGIAYELTHVETEADFAAALAAGQIDLILADFTLPGFDGMTALSLAHARCPDLPFIFVTATMGEEIAIDALKRGATDYILKGRLSRLAPAIRRALTEAEERSERRRAEEALRHSEEELRHSNELFRALIQASPLAIFLLNADGKVKSWNAAAERIFGWTEAEVQGEELPIVPEDNRKEFVRTCYRILQGHTVTRRELQRQRKDGVLIDISLNAAPIYDAQGNPYAILAMATDITERKRLDRKLAQSEQKFRTAFEAAAVGMCLTAIDHRVLVVNPSLCSMLDYTAEELTATDWLEVTHPDDQEKFLRWSDRIFAGDVQDSSKEIRFLNRGGQIVWAMVSKVLLREENGAPLYFITQVQNITEQKTLENQLRHAQKMEALGTLSAGIAHDFNNILTAIIGYGSLLSMRLDKNDSLRPFVEHILTAADRAATLTKSLLTFGRKQNIEPCVVDLNSVVPEVEKLLLRLLREDIELRTTLANSPCTVLADAGQIGQVLMNLATNARDAMPQGGKLAIRIAMASLDRDFVATHGYGAPGSYVLVTVTDTGVGMDAETRSRIFEPFFTTKEVGRGTGLGLSMAYGIVKQHNGYITCYSEPGAGTTFRIYLPAVDALAEAAIESLVEFHPGGTETILLAEDDEQVRVLTSSLLERFGFRVITAYDGKDALVQFHAHRDAIQLVLLDVIMPGKNGREVCEEMRKSTPGLKVLFTSGYSADIFQLGEFDEPSFAFISKPALPAELLRKIRQLLDE